MSELLAKDVQLRGQGLNGSYPSLSEVPPVDSFSSPQPGGVGGPLLEKARLGQLTPEHLDQVRLQLDRLQQSLVDEMEEESAEVENFRDGILDALGDAFALLKQERQRRLESELAEAYQRDAKDATWRDEASHWDAMAGDGINA